MTSIEQDQCQRSARPARCHGASTTPPAASSAGSSPAHDREIALLRRRHGIAVETLARAYGVGERQVWSVLRRQRRQRREGSRAR